MFVYKRCLENPQSVKYFMQDRSLIMQLTHLPWRWSKKKTVGHLPCEYSRILWLSHMAEKITANTCAQEWRFLVGWCSVVRVEWKLIVWKNCWRARFVDKCTTQMSPLGATTHEKVIEQQQHALSFFYVKFIPWHLKVSIRSTGFLLFWYL